MLRLKRVCFALLFSVGFQVTFSLADDSSLPKRQEVTFLKNLQTWEAAKTEVRDTQAKSKSPDQKVLDRFVGTWRIEGVDGRANGDQKKYTATVISKWSLQGQFIEQRGTDSNGKQVALTLITYDSEAGVYKAWTFASNSPKPTLLIMRWNGSKMTFTGKGDIGEGTTMHTVTHFITNDLYENTMTAKDASGEVVGVSKGKASRKK